MQPDEAAAASPRLQSDVSQCQGAFGGRERPEAILLRYRIRNLVPLGGPFRDIVSRNDAGVAGAD